MLSLSFLEKEKENVSLLININNGSINTALVSFGSNKIPKFLYSIEVPFVGEKPNIMKLSEGMSSLLDSSLEEIITTGWQKTGLKDKRLSHVIVSFSSPWFILKTKNIHLSKDDVFVVTKNFIDDITQKEEQLFKKELMDNYSENGIDEFVIIERSVVHAKINGYVVENIIGRKTKDFDVSLLVSAITKNIEDKVTSIIFKQTHIPKENIIVHSFPLVLFSTIRDSFENESNFLLINIDSEITDIVMVDNHIITSVISFPFGKNTIIRQLANHFKVSPEIAESQLVVYMSKKIEDSALDSTENLLRDLEKEWSVYFEDAIVNISSNMSWPKKTFVMADKNVASIFVDFLSLQKADATASFRKNMDLKLIDDAFLSGMYEHAQNKPVKKSMIILAVFYNKLRQIHKSIL